MKKNPVQEKTNEPTEPATVKVCDTSQYGYALVIPLNQSIGKPSVYKVYFGKKFFIWKGKALLQSCQLLAKGVSAGITRMNKGEEIAETDYLYHVLKHIKTTRCISGRVEVEADDFVDEFDTIDGLAVLKYEQRLLDEADSEGDTLCLNNNAQAYVPVNNIWITQPMKNAFLKWYKQRKK